MKTNSMRLIALLSLALILCFNQTKASDTTLTGNITMSGTWNTAMADTFRITSATLLSGRTLTIAPGVVVVIDGPFRIQGDLTVMGTNTAKVIFTGDSANTVSIMILNGESNIQHAVFDDFYQLRVQTGESNFENCEVRNLYQVLVESDTRFSQCTFESLSYGIRSTDYIELVQSVFRNIRGTDALYLLDGKFDIDGCEFYNNSRAMRIVFADGRVTNSVFKGNGDVNISGGVMFNSSSSGISEVEFTYNTFDSMYVLGAEVPFSFPYQLR
jgi:hypothetical protein